MSTITKESIADTIEGLEHLAKSGIQSVYIDMAIAGMCRLLASLEAEKNAEPVAKVEAVGVCWYADNGVPRKPAVGTELFAAPPAPAFVSDESAVELLATDLMKRIDKITGERHSVATLSSLRVSIVEACRAAMLQSFGNSEQLNSPVIHDGWVACSDRMPHIGVPVITCCGDVVQYAAYAWDGKEWQDWYEEYDKLPASTFTHWHPRPAAPQQEAKPL